MSAARYQQFVMRTKKNNTNIQQQQPRRKEKRKYANEINESSRCVRVCLCCVCIHCIMIWFFLYLSLRAPIEWIGRWISNMQHETRASMLMEIAHMHTLILIIIAHTQQFWLDFFSCKWIFAFFLSMAWMHNERVLYFATICQSQWFFTGDKSVPFSMLFTPIF